MFECNRWGLKAVASVIVALVFFVIGIAADSSYMNYPAYVVHERVRVVKEIVNQTEVIPTPFPVDCEKFGFVFDVSSETFQSAEKGTSSLTVFGVPTKITCTRHYAVQLGWGLKQNGVSQPAPAMATGEVTIFDRTPQVPLTFKSPAALASPQPKKKPIKSYDPSEYHVE